MRNLGIGFALLTLMGCSGSETTNPTVPTGEQTYSLSFANYSALEAEERSAISSKTGVWEGSLSHPTLGNYRLQVVIAPTGGTIVRAEFIDDERSTHFNAVNVFGVPSLISDEGDVTQMELNRPLNNQFWKDQPDSSINDAFVLLEWQNNELTVVVDLYKQGQYETFLGDAVPASTGAYNIWSDNTVLTGLLSHLPALYVQNQGNFEFAADDCLFSGSFLSPFTLTATQHVNGTLSCLSNTFGVTAGDYRGAAYIVSDRNCATPLNPAGNAIAFTLETTDLERQLFSQLCLVL
jgi:hypothetical protein